MSVRHFLLFILVCTTWGVHFTIVKWGLSSGEVAAGENAVKPLFYAAMRMTLVAVLLLPFLRWHSGIMIAIWFCGLCLGGLNYALIFSGVDYSNASIAAISMESYAPIMMVMSVIFLGEKVGPPRVIGLVMAMVGIFVIVSADGIDGAGRNVPLGVACLIGAAFVEVCAALVIKRQRTVPPLQLLAWFSLVGATFLWLLTLNFETNQMAAFGPGVRERFIPAVIYSAVIASIIGHSIYYYLIQRLSLSVLSTSLLLTTLVAVVTGIVVLKEPVTWQLIVGGGLTIGGVALILIREAQAKKKLAQEIQSQEKALS